MQTEIQNAYVRENWRTDLQVSGRDHKHGTAPASSPPQLVEDEWLDLADLNAMLSDPSTLTDPDAIEVLVNLALLNGGGDPASQALQDIRSRQAAEALCTLMQSGPPGAQAEVRAQLTRALAWADQPVNRQGGPTADQILRERRVVSVPVQVRALLQVAQRPPAARVPSRQPGPSLSAASPAAGASQPQPQLRGQAQVPGVRPHHAQPSSAPAVTAPANRPSLVERMFSSRARAQHDLMQAQDRVAALKNQIAENQRAKAALSGPAAELDNPQSDAHRLFRERTRLDSELHTAQRRAAELERQAR